MLKPWVLRFDGWTLQYHETRQDQSVAGCRYPLKANLG
jgi:hypothetical protein